MKTLIAVTAAALFCTTAPALAQSASDAPTTRVSYADLDLSRSNGRDVLERRIGNAIKRVCPTNPLPGELQKGKNHRACQRAAWTGARQQLAAIYDGRQLADAAVVVAARRAD